MSKVDFEKKKIEKKKNFRKKILLEKIGEKIQNFRKKKNFEILFFKIHFWHFYQIFDFVTVEKKVQKIEIS